MTSERRCAHCWREADHPAHTLETYLGRHAYVPKHGPSSPADNEQQPAPMSGPSAPVGHAPEPAPQGEAPDCTSAFCSLSGPHKLTDACPAYAMWLEEKLEEAETNADEWMERWVRAKARAEAAESALAAARSAALAEAAAKVRTAKVRDAYNHIVVEKLALELERMGAAPAAPCPTCGDSLPCAKAACTVARLPVIDDPAISAAMAALDEGAAPAEAAVPVRKLRELAQKWRKEHREYPRGPYGAVMLRLCVRELEALIALTPEDAEYAAE